MANVNVINKIKRYDYFLFLTKRKKYTKIKIKFSYHMQTGWGRTDRETDTAIFNKFSFASSEEKKKSKFINIMSLSRIIFFWPNPNLL